MYKVLKEYFNSWEHMETLIQAWQWILERWQVEDVILTEENTATWIIAIIAVVMFIVVWSDKVWDKVQFTNTIIHEVSHSVVAMLTGRRLHGLKLHSDASGVAVSSGNPRGIGMLLTTIAGYPGPSLLAVLMSWLLSIGYAGAALTIYHVLLLFGLLLVRNFFGLFAILSTAIFTLGVTIWGSPFMVSLTVIALILLYAVGGVRGTISLVKVHVAAGKNMKHLTRQQQKDEQENVQSSDASQAARLTFYILPTWFWIAAFLLMNAAALVMSLWLLIAQ